MEEAILKGICKRGMESGAGLSHAQEVVVLLPDSTCRQESDLKPKRCKRSPAGERLLECHLLTGTDWERARHYGPDEMSANISVITFSWRIISLSGCGGDC